MGGEPIPALNKGGSMKQIAVLKDFRFAENGHVFREFKAGDVAEVTDACADSAVQMGAAEDFRLATEANPQNVADVTDASGKPKAKK